MKRIVGILVALFLALAVLPAGAADKVSLPKGYERWEKSKEKVVNDKKSLFYGIHYIYVDKKAMKAYQAWGAYREGSRFVVVFYNIKDEGGTPARGKKNMVVLMEKNRKQAETGGWLFAGFTADGKFNATLDPVKNCFECHLKEAKATDYVISKYADFK